MFSAEEKKTHCEFFIFLLTLPSTSVVFCFQKIPYFQNQVANNNFSTPYLFEAIVEAYGVCRAYLFCWPCHAARWDSAFGMRQTLPFAQRSFSKP